MADEQKEFFRNIGISEEDLQYCYVSSDGQYFTPHYTDGIMDKTGEEVYNTDYLNQPTQEPTLADRLADVEIALASILGV